MDEHTDATVQDPDPPGNTALPLILSIAALLVWLALTVAFWLGLLHVR